MAADPPARALQVFCELWIEMVIKKITHYRMLIISLDVPGDFPRSQGPFY